MAFFVAHSKNGVFRSTVIIFRSRVNKNGVFRSIVSKNDVFVEHKVKMALFLAH